MKSAFLLSGLLAATTVFAQATGEYHRYMARSSFSFWEFIYGALLIGLTLLVWLYVAKVIRDLRKKK